MNTLQNSSTGARRPNIVYVHGHDIGRHIRPFGYAVDTPNMQFLAEAGILFRQVHAAAPTCSASRAALLTGESPHNAGMLGLAHRGFGLTHPERHLASTLSSAGYETILAGFQHVTHGDPSALGYTTLLDRDDFQAAAVMRNAAAWLEQHAAGPDRNPFFLDAGAFEAHRPFPEISERESHYIQPLPPLPDVPETRIDTARFQAAISDFDHAIGPLIRTIDRLGLTESTVIICTTDHGPPFPGMKCTLTAAGTGIMLIVRGPAPWVGGQVIDQLVSNIDLYPTICELAGIERPFWVQGASMVPLAHDPTHPIRTELFSEVTYHAAYEPMRAIRTDRWTFIRRFSERPVSVLPNTDAGESRDFLVEHDWGDRVIDPYQLYDNLLDPWNSANLFGRPEFGPIAEELADRLQRWMDETHDPLLSGPVPLPPGALVNPIDGDTPEGALFQAAADGSLTQVENPGALF